MKNFIEKGPKEEVLAKVAALVAPEKSTPEQAAQLENIKAFVASEISCATGRGVAINVTLNSANPNSRQFSCAVTTLYV